LKDFVYLAYAGVGYAFTDPSVPVHVVFCVEFDAACLEGDLGVCTRGLSWEYVEIEGVGGVFGG
jgi:hypothetical protein